MTRKISILVYAGLMVLLAAPVVFGQAVRFSTHREIAPPDYATFRLGPFYSTMALTERVGYRYTTSTGSGTDYIFNNSRGEIKEDGHDFPIISTLSFRNYLIINRNMDLDASFSLGYAYYPLDTQEDEFFFTLPEEGIYGAISSSFRLTPYVYGTIYDNISYQTDYVDTRGVNDRYGGSRYERFSNDTGAQMNWDVGSRERLIFGLSRYHEIPNDDEFEDQERVRYTESLAFESEVWDGARAGVRGRFWQTFYVDPEREDTALQDYSVYFTAKEGGMGMFPVGEASTLSMSVGVGVATSRGSERGEEINNQEYSPKGDSVELTRTIDLETQLSKTLRHSLGYARDIREGYNSSYEIYDLYSYRLNWQGEISSASFFSRYSDVESSGATDWPYTSWGNGATLSYPILDWLTLNASTVYTIRENKAEFENVDDPENSSNYDKWDSRIGTDFRIHKEMTFSTYFAHYERISDDEELEFTRDTFEAYVSYHHQF
ncbi:MAG: hypothetical protein ISS35_08535 [Kiritimatiellae bacterium]|nr:hypothetical protein [Kiritimatiellia bacterium]